MIERNQFSRGHYRPVKCMTEHGQTSRGFDLVRFVDASGKKCSLQQSSIGDSSCIWLGIDGPDPQILKSQAVDLGLLPPGEVSGWMPYPIPDGVSINTKMHLGQKQIEDLIEILQNWLEHGTLQKWWEDATKKDEGNINARFRNAKTEEWVCGKLLHVDDEHLLYLGLLSRGDTLTPEWFEHCQILNSV